MLLVKINQVYRSLVCELVSENGSMLANDNGFTSAGGKVEGTDM